MTGAAIEASSLCEDDEDEDEEELKPIFGLTFPLFLCTSQASKWQDARRLDG